MALYPGKVHSPTAAAHRRSPVKGSPKPTHAAKRQVEFPGSTLRIHPFASKRFHVLLNSLFKVLFNFPSRYLSAIGLVSVFSLRWSLPPSLGCIPKQPDSKAARSHRVSRRKGLTPALGEAPIRRTWAPEQHYSGRPKHHMSLQRKAAGFGAGLYFPLHSPILGESLLVSFPPLSDMLKFSG